MSMQANWGAGLHRHSWRRLWRGVVLGPPGPARPEEALSVVALGLPGPTCPLEVLAGLGFTPVTRLTGGRFVSVVCRLLGPVQPMEVLGVLLRGLRTRTLAGLLEPKWAGETLATFLSNPPITQGPPPSCWSPPWMGLPECENLFSPPPPAPPQRCWSHPVSTFLPTSFPPMSFLVMWGFLLSP